MSEVDVTAWMNVALKQQGMVMVLNWFRDLMARDLHGCSLILIPK